MDRELLTGRIRCFSHPDRESVSFCALCSRALCHECGVSVAPMACACKGKHEKQLRRLRASVLKTRRWSARSLFSLFAVAVASLLVMLGILSRPFSFYKLLPGLAFLAYTLIFIVRRKRHLISLTRDKAAPNNRFDRSRRSAILIRCLSVVRTPGHP
jgi:hypothetical protein